MYLKFCLFAKRSRRCCYSFGFIGVSVMCKWRIFSHWMFMKEMVNIMNCILFCSVLPWVLKRHSFLIHFTNNQKEKWKKRRVKLIFIVYGQHTHTHTQLVWVVSCNFSVAMTREITHFHHCQCANATGTTYHVKLITQNHSKLKVNARRLNNLFNLCSKRMFSRFVLWMAFMVWSQSW